MPVIRGDAVNFIGGRGMLKDFFDTFQEHGTCTTVKTLNQTSSLKSHANETNGELCKVFEFLRFNTLLVNRMCMCMCSKASVINDKQNFSVNMFLMLQSTPHTKQYRWTQPLFLFLFISFHSIPHHVLVKIRFKWRSFNHLRIVRTIFQCIPTVCADF